MFPKPEFIPPESLEKSADKNLDHLSDKNLDHLSITANLEALHRDNLGHEDDDWMFAKPLLPVKPVKNPFKEPDLEVKPGKSWRRSISLARRTSCLEMKAPTNVPNLQAKKSRSSFIIVHNNPSIKKPDESALNVIDESLEDEEFNESVSEKLQIMSQSILQLNVSKPQNLEQDDNIPDEYLRNLLQFCSKPSVVGIFDIYEEGVLKSSVKVGEGAFGEVFLINSAVEDKPVLKVVPIGGEAEVNGEVQTSFEEIL